MKYPKALEELIASFKKLPGIGPKTAERLALHVLLGANKEDVLDLSHNLLKALEEVHPCKRCGILTDQDLCFVCKDYTRTKQLMILENNKDMISIEVTGQYYGRYHILNGVISALNGVGPDDINLSNLKQRIKDEGITEVIISTNTTLDGEMTAYYINNLLKDELEVYRIGYGLPANTNIEYANATTLIKALEGKRKM
ncbi:MAG: recombination mediator RecR [Bacilli bacterium]